MSAERFVLSDEQKARIAQNLCSDQERRKGLAEELAHLDEQIEETEDLLRDEEAS